MMNKASILYVIISLKAGGTERHISQLLPALKQQGFDVKVFLLESKGIMEKPLKNAGIEIIDGQQWSKKIYSLLPHFLKKKSLKIVEPKNIGVLRWPAKWGFLFHGFLISMSYFLATLQLHSYLRKSKMDICHGYLPLACIISFIAGTLAGQKIILGSRRSLSEIYREKRPWGHRIEKIALSKMSAILGNSKAVVEQLLREGMPKERVGLIYNGIDPNQYQCHQTAHEIRKEENINKEAFVMLILASLIPYKGHMELIQCLGQINKDLPIPWTLVCIGQDNGIMESLRTESENLGIKPNIYFLGARQDVGRLLKMCDVAVSCSHSEGFSNSIIECKFLGLPVIATRVGGNQEAILHEETGLLVEPDNIELLGKAILDLALHPEKRKRMGEAAHKRVMKNFSYNQCIENHIKLYESLLRDKNTNIGELLPYSG